MYCHLFPILLLLTLSPVNSKFRKCEQIPSSTTTTEPNENIHYHLTVETKDKSNNYLPDQTYVLNLKTDNKSKPFRAFMITAENPEMDDNKEDYFLLSNNDVGTLKILDGKSRYSERCSNSVENTDTSGKDLIVVHWVSPKHDSRVESVRLRAMVVENDEVWYSGGEDLEIILKKNLNKPVDSPPVEADNECDLCSEARYQVVFRGLWSRISHHRHYPTKPDENGYTFLVGASHAYDYSLWKEGAKASKGLSNLVTSDDDQILLEEIVNSMSETGGTRTLLRGKKNRHPYMREPSSSIFRVDRIHHLFSLVVGIRPSPDWFLGASGFELCTSDGWIDSFSVPLYPWDAGVQDGISYESPTSWTNPSGNIARVAVGSFDKESPFYQLNLNDLKPFANLTVTRLDVYPLVGEDCSDKGEATTSDTENTEQNDGDEPKVSESRSDKERCLDTKWSSWSECQPYMKCGAGTKFRTKVPKNNAHFYNNPEYQELKVAGEDDCYDDLGKSEIRNCIVPCYT